MRIVAMLALTVLTACASVEDLRSGNTVFEGESSKSPTEYGPCVAEKWSALSGGRAQYMPIPQGVEVLISGIQPDIMLKATNQGGGSRIHVGSRIAWHAPDYVRAADECR